MDQETCWKKSEYGKQLWANMEKCWNTWETIMKHMEKMIYLLWVEESLHQLVDGKHPIILIHKQQKIVCKSGVTEIHPVHFAHFHVISFLLCFVLKCIIQFQPCFVICTNSSSVVHTQSSKQSSKAHRHYMPRPRERFCSEHVAKLWAVGWK